LTAGATTASAATKIHRQHAIARARWLDSKISMNTATGARRPIMDTFGIHAWMPVGRHITMGIGPGLILGDGPGSTTQTGVTLRSTMDDGL